VGACFEEREKSRVSFLPALRSRASEPAWSRSRFSGCGERVPGPRSSCRLRFPRVSWALARAPKEIEPMSSSSVRLLSPLFDYNHNEYGKYKQI